MESKTPITKCLTKNDIIKHFVELGIKPGMVLEVHSSLSSFGYVVGGARVVVDALLELVGKEGTILMPLQGSVNSEPSRWEKPPVQLDLVKVIRDNTPAYHKNNSDTFKMGAIVNNFHRRQGVEISAHPSVPFAAWGKHAKFLCNRQSLHFSLSEESPLARLYELRGSILLLGVGYDCCTMMHLGEYRSDCRPILLEGAAIEIDGHRVWKKYLDLELNKNDFNTIGEIIENLGEVQKVKIGDCDVKLFRADVASATTSQYLEKKTVYHLYR